MEAAEDEEASMKLIFGWKPTSNTSSADGSHWKIRKVPVMIFWKPTRKTTVVRFINSPL